MSTKSRQTIYGSRIRGAKIHGRKREASRREGHSRGRPRRGRGLVDPRGGLWRAGAAGADDRAMPQWGTRLARGRVQALQDPREPAARCHPPAAGYADLEARSVAEMPVMPEGPLCAAGAYDQADRDARDHAVSLGASG